MKTALNDDRWEVLQTGTAAPYVSRWRVPGGWVYHIAHNEGAYGVFVPFYHIDAFGEPDER